MSFEDIRIHHDYTIINNFIQIPPNEPLDKISMIDDSIEAMELGEIFRLSLGSTKETGSKHGPQRLLRTPGVLQGVPNTAPTLNSVPATFTVDENTEGDIIFPTPPFQDVDTLPGGRQDGQPLTVTLAIPDGTITGNPGTGITISGAATAKQFVGTKANLNAYAGTPGKIKYTPALNNTTSRVLTTTLSDGLASVSAASTVNITPTPVASGAVFTIRTATPGLTFTLPVLAEVTTPNRAAAVMNCTVDWGDGQSDVIVSPADPKITHTYVSAGDYIITITGQCTKFAFNYAAHEPAVPFADRSGRKIIGVTTINGDALGLSNTNGAYAMFGDCRAIVTVAPNCFDGWVSNTSFESVFASCRTLPSIPTDLFRYNTLVTSFRATLWQCYELTGIPTDLFRYNTLVSERGFYGTFNLCTKIPSIPTDLFRYNTLNNSFESTFQDCELIVSIPVDLFRYNTLVADYGFNQCFNDCSALTTIPAGIFDYNVLAWDFTNCFGTCACTATSVNNFLVSLDSTGMTGGIAGIGFGSNAAPTGVGATAKTSLQGKGWSVTTN